MRKEPNYKNFLPGGDHEQWIAKKIDSKRGITVDYEQNDDVNTTETNRRAADQEAAKISGQLEDFLSTIASKCLEGMFRTIVNEATSMEWILKRIRTAFRLESKGINFYDTTLKRFDEEKDGSYDVAYMNLKTCVKIFCSLKVPIIMDLNYRPMKHLRHYLSPSFSSNGLTALTPRFPSTSRTTPLNGSMTSLLPGQIYSPSL